ncbi:MAG TPA: transglycosylase SLT domain-containing protein [Lysobacter sp.]|jgi:type IV secretion system protein VirB1|nr:transglycosylase SLT domain-containing protein [Lysobacter sp.]
MELMNCPNLAVPNEVMHHVVYVESSYNPYAIGVVGGRLARQPKNLAEALATVRMLESKGYNFSLGLAQVNRYNLSKYGLASYESAFEACPNLQAGSRILAECYGRSSGDWGKSFSCYYSGNFTTGFRHGYVQKVYASMRGAAAADSEGAPIEVIGKPSRLAVPVTRHSVHSMERQLMAKRVDASAVPQPLPQGQAIPASTPSPTPASNNVAVAAVLGNQPVAPMVGTPEIAPSRGDQAFVF